MSAKKTGRVSAGGGSASGGKKRDIDFLFEIGSLRNIDRSWRQHLGVACASGPEHAFRVAFLALLIARGEKKGDENKIFKMALVHDLAETRVGDIGYIQKVYVRADEHRAADDVFADTSFADLRELLTEYESRKSVEAKIVKDADNLDIDLELRELEEQGHALPKKLFPMRKFVRAKKLYTKTAKKLWTDIYKGNVAAWHLRSNKWHKVPHAGR